MSKLTPEETLANAGSMTDEEWMNMPLTDDEPEEALADEEENTEAEPEETLEETAEEEDLDEPEAQGDIPPEIEGSSEEPEVNEADEEDPDTSDTDVTPAEEQLAQLFAPFRANGTEMKVDSVDEALMLMKKGAGFNKKMQVLKPNLKLIKMLDNNGLLDESKLSHLIDISKKDPKAIAKLIRDSGLDPLDIDTSENTDYTQGTYTVDDSEIDLDETLAEIRDSKGYAKTLDILSNKWDEQSKNVLLNNPSAIKQINEHVELGIYDQINVRLEKDRMLGKLTGVSDLDAYKQVGDQLAQEGAFAHLQPKSTQPAVKPKAKAKVDSETRKRKLAASSTKSSKASKTKVNASSPLSMTDEEANAEFEKLMGFN